MPDSGMLAMVRAQQDRVGRRVPRLPKLGTLEAVWAVAWAVGFGLVWLAAPPSAGSALLPAWVVWLLFALVLGTAMLGSAGQVAGLVTTTRGLPRRLGVLLGWSWPAGFAGVGLLMALLGLAGLSRPAWEDAVVQVFCVLVAALFLAGGLLWRDGTQFLLGVGIALLAQAADALGAPGGYLLICLAGATVFALAAVAPVRDGGRARSIRS